MARKRDADQLRADVKAAYLEMVEAGVYPSLDRLCRKLRATDYLVDAARAHLVDDGEVPPIASPYATWKEDDPFLERPDDPDADEIQRRIAEVRAEKDAEAMRETVLSFSVTTAKHHRRVHRLRAFA